MKQQNKKLKLWNIVYEKLNVYLDRYVNCMLVDFIVSNNVPWDLYCV